MLVCLRAVANFHPHSFVIFSSDNYYKLDGKVGVIWKMYNKPMEIKSTKRNMNENISYSKVANMFKSKQY